MNKPFLFAIMMVAASFHGLYRQRRFGEILTDPVGEVNVPGNALVFTRDADETECPNGGINLDVGVDVDGDGMLNSTEFSTQALFVTVQMELMARMVVLVQLLVIVIGLTLSVVQMAQISLSQMD